MAFIPDYRIATFIAGVLTLLMGALVLGMAPRHPLHRATALFFVFRGGWFTTVALLANDLAWSMRIVPYFFIVIPFAAIWMAVRMHQSFANRPSEAWTRPVAVTLGAIVLLLEGWYALNHAAFTDGALGWLPGATQVVYMGLAMFIGWEFLSGRGGTCRRALYAFTLGFVAEPVYHATFMLLQWATLAAPPSDYQIGSIIVVGMLAGGLAWSWHKWEPLDRTRLLVLLSVSVASAALVMLNVHYSFASFNLFSLLTLNAFWTAWVVGAAAYATLRYHVFSLDLRVKWFLRYGSTTAIMTTVFWVASEWLEQQFDASTTLRSILIAAAVSISIYPLLKATTWVFERLMPGVDKSDQYQHKRRAEMYGAAYERALQDGDLAPDEQMALEQLAKGLGLKPSQTKEIEQTSRASLS